MPVTDGNALPYPALTDQPSGPDQLQSLAAATDDVLVALQGAQTDLENKAAPDSSASLPSDPVDGQLAYFNAPAGGGGDYAVVWVMRFSETLGLWQAVGGMPASSRDDSAGTRAANASGNYDDLSGTGAGPIVNIPSGYSGQVIVRIEARVQSGNSGESMKASWRIGSDTPSDSVAIISDSTNSTVGTRTSGAIDVSGGDVLTMKYWRTSSGTSTVGRRTIAVYPLTADPV